MGQLCPGHGTFPSLPLVARAFTALRRFRTLSNGVMGTPPRHSTFIVTICIGALFSFICIWHAYCVASNKRATGDRAGMNHQASISALEGLCREILDYFQTHPNAADTVEGIANWWLPRQRYETTRARIQLALDRLVAEGLVEAKLLADGAMVYRSCRSDTKLGD